ncbi:MAG: NAD(P)H-dependent flavin oxidoreductase [Sarcina sp.]
MKIEALKIGNLVARLPIIQGGMGVGVSLSNLAAAVANAGGIGIISTAFPGYDEPDFETNLLEANLRALKKHIKRAKEKAPNGIIGINAMVAITNYEDYVKAAVEAGIDLVISGAGLPKNLPELVKGSKTKIAPIISSVKGARVIMRLWDRNYNAAPDLVVVEGPKAGGHLGFKKDEVEASFETFDEEIPGIVEEVKKYEEKYNKKIPVVVGGGVYTGADIAKYLKLGASGVQMATRFVATDECDAHENFKKAYINAGEENISLVKSPVGMPGRAMRNDFVKAREEGNEKITKCYNCLLPCNPATTPYCISAALIRAVKGDVDSGLVFCGSNAYKVDKIVPVQELMNELEQELLAIPE